MKCGTIRLLLSTAASISALWAGAAGAQEDRSSEASGLSDIVVTAQKRGVAEDAQRVPIAITALGTEAIRELNVRDLSSLTVTVPNVQLDSLGTIPSAATFSIRGFGISATTPSVEPTVGVFFDGVYQGITTGVLLDMFDVESIEILRGPQGTLFGRNTTGGAASIRTKRPGDEFQVTGRIGIESGPLITTAASIEGPLGTDRLRAKLTGYRTHDNGYFYNRFDGAKFGKRTTQFIRPTLVFEPTDNLDTTLIYEWGRIRGEGPPVTNPRINPGDDIEVNIDFRGLNNVRWERVTSETNWNVGLGDGVITNIAGFRWVTSETGQDADASPQTLFNQRTFTRQRQFSEELRYAGTFGPLAVTVGGFYFTQRYIYVEERRLAPALLPVGFGGRNETDSWAAFGELALNVTPELKLVAGGRYSWERKTAQVASFFAAGSRCNFDTRTCVYDFPGPNYPGAPGTKSFTDFNPKVGFNYQARPDLLFYGTYSQGLRSGGFNVRSTARSIAPGPYAAEVQDAFEIGAKTQFFDKRLRVNVAAFRNTLHNLQQDVTSVDPVAGTVQITQNVGTARITGAEIEIQAAPARGILIGASGGYLDGKYVTLAVDLNGAAPGFGVERQLPRVPKFTYGVFASFTHELGSGDRLQVRGDFGHRDSMTNIANTLDLHAFDNLSFNIAYTFGDDRFTLSAYGRNMLDEFNDQLIVPISPAQGGGSIVNFAKGRTIGAQFDFRF